MTRSAFSQAAASNNTNKEALGAQDGDSHASAASDTSAQLTARAILTIQRRAVNGRSGRPTPSKVDSLIRQAQDQAAATGTRLTTDYTLLEQLPIILKQSKDGGSDGGTVSGLSTDGAPPLAALPADFRQSRRKRTTLTDTDSDNDNDDTQPGIMQAPGPLLGLPVRPEDHMPKVLPIRAASSLLQTSTVRSMPLLADKSRTTSRKRNASARSSSTRWRPSRTCPKTSIGSSCK